MRLTEARLKMLVEEVIEEGFFDLEDSPVLQKLGMVSKEETPLPATAELPEEIPPPEEPDIYESDDPWIQFMNACNKALSETARRFSKDEDFEEMMDLLKPKFDLNNNGFVGDKGDMLVALRNNFKEFSRLNWRQKTSVFKQVEKLRDLLTRFPKARSLEYKRLDLFPEYLSALSKYAELEEKGPASFIKKALDSNSFNIEIFSDLSSIGSNKKQMTFSSDDDGEMKQMALDSDVAKAYDNVGEPIGYQGPMKFKFECTIPLIKVGSKKFVYLMEFYIDLSKELKNLSNLEPLKIYGATTRFAEGEKAGGFLDRSFGYVSTDVQRRAVIAGKKLGYIASQQLKQGKKDQTIYHELYNDPKARVIMYPEQVNFYSLNKALKALETILAKY